jgi:hypothetical protein
MFSRETQIPPGAKKRKAVKGAGTGLHSFLVSFGRKNT